VSGYGQSGKMSLRPGHDLNYLSIGGVLPLLNEDQYLLSNGKRTGVKGEKVKKQLQFPSNHYADFLVTSLGVPGVMLALI
jgi:crotonobetainyl-CoA:carnitine CoA-transferase CaiB-like acyl-CoA transferase